MVLTVTKPGSMTGHSFLFLLVEDNFFNSMADPFSKTSVLSCSEQILFAAMLCISISGCKHQNSVKHYPSPSAYDLNHPFIFKLPPALDEISGIVYYPKDKSIFCIHDEKGVLFKLHLNERMDLQQWNFKTGSSWGKGKVKAKLKLKKWKYGTDADIEDLA